MLGSALYYPYIDIRDPVWLRAALLFWDKLHTIVPSKIEKPYESADSDICSKEGYLSPVRCGDHLGVIDELSKRTVDLLNVDSLPVPVNVQTARSEPNLTELLRAFRSGTRSQLHRDKLGRSLLHPEKLSYQLREVFERAKTAKNGDWLLVNESFSDIYMAALALLLADKTDLSPVTSSSSNHGSAIISMLAGSAPTDDTRKGALVSLTMKGLVVDPKTKIDKILKFKRKRNDQLIEFSTKLDDLKKKLEGAADLREMEEKATRVYRTQIHRGLEKLASELRDVSIQNAWGGFYRGVFFTLPAQSLVAGVAAAVPGALSPVSQAIAIGVGGLLTVTDVAIKTLFARRQARKASPFTYLLDAKNAFSLPSESSALSIIQEYEQLPAQ